MKQDISVIIPSYNRGAILHHSVESVLNQTHPVSEVIVVDDGSTDDTAQIMDRHFRERPSWRAKVRYVRQENQGQSVANNRGIELASTTWLGFNANDDLWLPWKLEWQFRALEKFGSDYGVCFADAWFMNNPYMKTNIFRFAGKADSQAIGVVQDGPKLIAAEKHPVWMQTVIARTDLVRQTGGVDPAMRYSEDHDFMFRLALLTKLCFVSMPMVLVDRSPADERHTGVSRNWHREEFCLNMDQYRFEKQLKLSEGLDAGTRDLIKNNLSRVHSAWANWHLDQGHDQEALASISKALQYHWTARVFAKWLGSRLLPGLTRFGLNVRDKDSAPRHDRVSWQADDKPSVM